MKKRAGFHVAALVLLCSIASAQYRNWEVHSSVVVEGRATLHYLSDLRLLHVTDDSLYVARARGDSTPFTIPLESLLHVRRGNAALAAFRSATIGLLVGGSVGYVTGRILDGDRPDRGERETNYTPGLAIGGGVAGALIGGLGVPHTETAFDLQDLSTHEKVTVIHPLTENARDLSARYVRDYDVVSMKNGTILRGRVIEVLPDSIVRLETADGSLFVLGMEEVERITREKMPDSSHTDRPVMPPTKSGRRTQLAFLAGYGAEDGFNVGLGIRIGGALSSGPYLGFLFMHHFGKSVELGIAGFGSGSFEITVNNFYLGPEVGYEARATEKLVVRPYLNFGYFNAMVTSNFGGNSETNSEARFYTAPGILFNILVDRKGTIGVDTRYVIVSGKGGSEASAFGLFLSAGVVL